VIGKQYFVRQAATLLKFAKSTKNPDLAAVLVEKAADLKSKVDESPAPRASGAERSRGYDSDEPYAKLEDDS
jgi:hypothetical protein